MFNLTVRAFDLGTPPLFSDANVKVFILDENDHAPTFVESFYKVTLPEDAPGGTEVLQVQAEDLDGSAPYNDIVYRITSGAKDKFVIVSDTGKVTTTIHLL